MAGLAGITIAAWLYIVVTARRMATDSTDMSGHSMLPMMDSMTGIQPWTATEFGLRLTMWAVMMVAMMVPTAAPMTLMYAAVARKAAAQHNPVAPTFVFVSGYLAMWTIFSLVATLAQLALDRAERGDWLAGLGVQCDQPVAGRVVEDAFVAAAVGPVGESAAG